VPDYIGNIAVPEIVPIGTFPLVPDHGYGTAIEPVVVTHQFGSGDAKIEQRFYLGSGAKKFIVRVGSLTDTERQSLREFWEARRGGYGAFTYNAPNDQGTGTTAYTCRFGPEPLTWEFLLDHISSFGVTLIEIPSTTPTYNIVQTLERFPDSLLATSLLSQVQEMIPLMKIQPRESGYPAIYISDRRVQISGVGGQLYLPRLIDFEGIAQSLGNESDQAQFILGNADRVMKDVVNDVDFFRAELEFSLYHVATGIKLDLWKGDVIDWRLDAGPFLYLTAADGIYELNLPYPTRRISRTCWKPFDRGDACPFSLYGSMDYGHFPSASPVSCDKGYDTPNGCLAHGMKKYHGALPVEPEGVRIKDNSTGTWGFGRSSITSVSIKSESVYDQVVPEIYTDADMAVNCKVASGRDESDFYDALGIVGEGPIVFGRGHKLDGQFHHGYPGGLGLREVEGDDPAADGDYLSLSQLGNKVGGDWRKVYYGASTYKDNFAAGTAFLELRRADEKGLQLSRPADHTMEAVVSQGLKGWVWSGSGQRSWQTLTNPIWVALNMMLRARGLRYADVSTAEKYFHVGACVAAASICNEVVTKMVGSGTETQFKFRGVLQEEKPLRDWIQEVLMNALGYFSFAFGKFKPGIRVNSSAVESFTLGNIIFESLQLAPRKPAFNHLTANFADEEFEFANNSVVLYDIDHASYIGGVASPLYLKGSMNLAGTASKSQAARIVTTRLKEELGGIDLSEWKYGRVLSFRTTVLALNTEPGMVCSMTHPDMPGPTTYGEFRVTGWKLNKDFSIDITGQTTTDSMYSLIAGPKPADVEVSPFPHTIRDLLPRPPFGWMPWQRAPLAADPIYDPTEWTFDLAPSYETASDGTALARLVLTGKLPVNIVSTIRPPIINPVATYNQYSGYVKGGKTYYIAICAVDQEGLYTQPSSGIAKVDVPALTDTNTLLLSVESWPDGAPGGYHVFAGEDRDRLSWQTSGTGTPGTIYLDGPLMVAAWGMPDTEVDKLRVKVKKIFHSGVFGSQVLEVTADTIKVAGGDFGTDQWAGYVCTIAALYNEFNPLPVLSYKILSNTSDTLTLEAGHNPLTDGVQPLDVIIMRARPTVVGSNYIGDPNFQNCFHPTGANPGEEVGRMLRIIANKGRGQRRIVTSNTPYIWYIDRPWTVTPDATSIMVIEETKWEVRTESPPIENDMHTNQAEFRAGVDNLLRETVLVQGALIDGNSHETPDEDCPVREIYLFGGPGNVIRDWDRTFVDGSDPIVEGTDLMDNHYRVRLEEGEYVLLDEFSLQLKTETDSELRVDIKRSSDNGSSWDSLFTIGYASVLGGEKRGLNDDFAIPYLYNDDILRYDVLAASGGGLEGSLKGRVVQA